MQTPRILITDGGPHPADKWAATTAAQIADLIQISETSTSEAAIAARKAKPRLELDLRDILEAFHANVQSHERALIAANGDAQLVKPLLPDDGVIDTPAEVAGAVANAAANTPFAAHFASPQVKAVVAGIIEDHAGKSIDIERSWHADRNPDGAIARAYRAARTEFGPRRAHLHLRQFQDAKAPARGK